MANQDSVIISDRYCMEIGQFCRDTAEQLEEALQEYLNILEEIKKNAIVAGDMADSLQVFIQYAKKMKGQIEVMGKIAMQTEKKFLNAVDMADQYLF